MGIEFIHTICEGSSLDTNSFLTLQLFPVVSWQSSREVFVHGEGMNASLGGVRRRPYKTF